MKSRANTEQNVVQHNIEHQVHHKRSQWNHHKRLVIHAEVYAFCFTTLLLVLLLLAGIFVYPIIVFLKRVKFL